MAHTKIGLIGAGLLGLAHGASLAILRNAGICDLELVSVFDPNGAAAESLVKNIGFRSAADSAEEIIANEEIDTVFISSPTRFHKDCVVAAASRRKNIFCEKPLAVDVSGARLMGDAVKRAGVTAGVGLVLHYSPTYRFIKNTVAAADTGPPIIVTLRDDQCFPIRGLHHTSWRADPSISGGGALIEHSIHDLDLLAWLFGRPRIADACVRYRTKRQGIEDYARVTMEFDNGMEGFLASVWHDMVTRASNRRLEIMYERLFVATDHDIIGPVEYTRGDEGRVVVDSDHVLAAFLEDLGLSEPFFRTLDYQTFGAYTVEDYFFIKAVQEQTDYCPGFDDAVIAHELVDEVYRAAS
ncbi:MAG: Gfo/Idh/MocA family oxidoreductase [Deltaproteobacteria bacterium]|nr:Gfo/Idh/MocA family oxidoreductase [Candidatus Zymogenaceae bacterium]